MVETAGNVVVLSRENNCSRSSRIIVNQVERTPTKTNIRGKRDATHTRGLPVANMPYRRLHLWGGARKPGRFKPKSFARARCQVKQFCLRW